MTTVETFNWAEELEKTVTHSLATSFGLDFLLFKDKTGGSVDTIHNARQSIYANELEKDRYDNRGDYDGNKYHNSYNYIQHGKNDKTLQQKGQLKDRYRNKTMGPDKEEKRNLDHIIAAKEVHNDRGRVLAELDGPDLANRDSNLASTSESINKSKQAKPISVFLEDVKKSISNMEADLSKKENILRNMPQETAAEKHDYRELESKINDKKKNIEQLKSIDSESMKSADRDARKDYEQTVNSTYYTGSKFMKQSAFAAADAGWRMGTRQMLGLVMAEAWFELREQVPNIVSQHKSGFQLDDFLGDVLTTFRSIWDRLKNRFKEFLVEFKDGVFSGVLSSATTTLFNIFATTQKMVVKLIREMWVNLVQAVKIVVFNPDKLNRVEILKAVTKILTAGVATVAGTMIFSHLAPILSFPFGTELAAFIGALATGVITLGFQYFLDHSSLMKKVWAFLEHSAHIHTLEQFRAINARLDEYLRELSRIELNLDPFELQEFSFCLASLNDEIERGVLLQQEVSRRNIDLPFAIGDHGSTRQWLSGLANK